MAAHFRLVFGMIVGVSSDLGSAGIVLGVFLVMFFAAGVKLYWFAAGFAAVAAAIPLLWNYFLKDYQERNLWPSMIILSILRLGHHMADHAEARWALPPAVMTGVDDHAQHHGLYRQAYGLHLRPVSASIAA
ncbi:MAG: hypothetical protein V8S87_01735 [Oscillospiraceae bacterium]